jgi:hypothetical protein
MSNLMMKKPLEPRQWVRETGKRLQRLKQRGERSLDWDVLAPRT